MGLRVESWKVVGALIIYGLLALLMLAAGAGLGFVIWLKFM